MTLRWACWIVLVAGWTPAAAQMGSTPGQQGPDVINLGVLGLGVEAGGGGLDVVQVHEGPARAAGIQERDRIVAVDGERLGATPVAQVVEAIEAAEAERRRPVRLTIERGGREAELAVRVARLGEHDRDCLEDCDKCERVARAGLERLVALQGSDGSFPTELGGQTGLVVVTSLGGLALHAAGIRPRGNTPLARALEYVLRHVGQEEASPFGGSQGGGNWNQVNWELGYGLMFLSEMARVTRRRDVLAKCQELVERIQANQERSGGWAHGPGGPNALGYLELEIVGNYLLAGLGAAQRLGLEVDQAAVERAVEWIEGTSPGDGGVGYSQRQGQRFGDPGRTAGAIVAYRALDLTERPFYAQMQGYLEAHLEELVDGHVSPAMHLVAGAMATRVLDEDLWEAYSEAFRLHIMQHRLPDGGFAATPTEESRQLRNNTDRQVGEAWITASYVLILELDPERFPLILGED